MQAANQNSAGAAITLSAAFLGALQRAAQAQIVEQRLVGRHIGQRDGLAIENEPKFGPGLCLGHDQLPR